MRSRAVPSRRQIACNRQHGFSLIEVLVALFVLSVGLLGFAMLQTMSVRFTQSAHYRTQATLWADSLLEQVRADRASAGAYTGSYMAATNAAQCMPATGAISSSKFRSLGSCQLGRALGAEAKATVNYASGAMTVVVSWSNDRGSGNSGGEQMVTLVSQL